MKCRQCKSFEFTPSHRSREERLLSYFVPLRPYRCIGCNERRWGLTDPVFNINRLVFLLVVSILSLYFVNFFVTRVTAVRIQPEKSRQEVSRPVEGSSAGTKSEAVSDRAGVLEHEGGENDTELGTDPVESAAAVGTEAAPTDRLPTGSNRELREVALSNRGPEEKPSNDSRAQLSKQEAGSGPTTATEAEKHTLSVEDVPTRSHLLRIHSYQKGGAAGIYLVISGARPRVRKNFLGGQSARWVIDLLGDWETETGLPKELFVETPIFSRARFGNHPKQGYFRIVFDLNPGTWPEPRLSWSGNHLLVEIDPG